MPFVPLYLRRHSFIYLSILGQFTSLKLLRTASSYETSQSVGVVKTGEPQEKKNKKQNKKKTGISSGRTCLT